MFTLLRWVRVVLRPASSLNALGCAALVLLIKTPRDLFDPSFQLNVSVGSRNRDGGVGRYFKHSKRSATGDPRARRRIRPLVLRS